MRLRSYQIDALEALRDRVAAGRVAPLCVSPTGSGKTVMLTELVRLHLELDPTNRVLVVCHRKEIIGQIASTILRSGIMDIGEILPGVTPRPACRVQVASTQTLRARNMRPHATLIIYDEAHHYSSDDWHELTKLYPGVLRIGFTATPMRSDGRGMSPAFDSLVVVSTIKELTRLGYLVPCRVIAPAVPIKKPSLSHSPVDAYLAHANGARTVVFADFIVNAEKFVAEFQEKGVRAVIVHGEMKDAERARAFAEHETGAVLVNCMVLTEGWDSPETKVCILARGCGSVGTYLQIVGRVLRPCSKCPSCAWSKANPSLERRGCERMALLIDLTGRSFYSHGAPDADRVYSLTGKGIRTSDTEADTPHCPVCGQPVEAPPNSWPCAVCGHEEEAGSQIEDPRYTGDELAERYAGKRTESDDKRIETLARWFAEAKSRADVNARKGDSWKWAAVAKYRAVYGDAPTNSIRMQAEALAQTLACVQCKECKKPAARTYQGGKCGGCAFKKRKG